MNDNSPTPDDPSALYQCFAAVKDKTGGNVHFSVSPTAHPKIAIQYRSILESFATVFTKAPKVAHFTIATNGIPRITIRESGKLIHFAFVATTTIFFLYSWSKGFSVGSLYVAIGFFVLMAIAGHAELLRNPVVLTPASLRRPFPIWERFSIEKPVFLALNRNRDGLDGDKYFVQVSDADGKHFLFPVDGLYRNDISAWMAAFFLSFWYNIPIKAEGVDHIQPETLGFLEELTNKKSDVLLSRVVYAEEQERLRPT